MSARMTSWRCHAMLLMAAIILEMGANLKGEAIHKIRFSRSSMLVRTGNRVVVRKDITQIYFGSGFSQEVRMWAFVALYMYNPASDKDIACISFDSFPASICISIIAFQCIAFYFLKLHCHQCIRLFIPLLQLAGFEDNEDWGIFEFGEYSSLGNIQVWGIFKFWEYSILGNIQVWGIFKFAEYSSLGNIQVWGIFKFGEYSSLWNIQVWGIFEFWKYSSLGNIQVLGIFMFG